MSENNNNEKTVPLEFPSRQQKIMTEPIVDVVENEAFPKKTARVQQIISKAPRE